MRWRIQPGLVANLIWGNLFWVKKYLVVSVFILFEMRTKYEINIFEDFTMYNFDCRMALATPFLLLLVLATFAIAQYDPYGQRPYNQNTDRPNYNQYDRNNPNNPNNPYDRDRQYDRPGQGLSDRERYDRFDKNRTDLYGQQNPYDRDRYGQGQGQGDRYNPYDRNRTYPGGYDRNRPDAYNPYGNRSDPYGQPYDRDHRYGQGQGQYPAAYPGQPGGRLGGHDDGTCCEDYCYERDREQQTKFATVTAYQFASGRHQVNQDVPRKYRNILNNVSRLMLLTHEYTRFIGLECSL